ELPGIVVLKARGMNMAVAGNVSADPWDEEALTAGAVNGRGGTGCGGCHDDIQGIIEQHFQGPWPDKGRRTGMAGGGGFRSFVEGRRRGPEFFGARNRK
ncbi:MAG: hypothetical protein ABWX69_07050, partial [Arthrobacter sp.]